MARPNVGRDSYELATGTFEHAVGIVDFETREVWMPPDEHWSHAAWGPRPA